jgi:hypothetical protein
MEGIQCIYEIRRLITRSALYLNMYFVLSLLLAKNSFSLINAAFIYEYDYLAIDFSMVSKINYLVVLLIRYSLR